MHRSIDMISSFAVERDCALQAWEINGLGADGVVIRQIQILDVELIALIRQIQILQPWRIASLFTERIKE